MTTATLFEAAGVDLGALQFDGDLEVRLIGSETAQRWLGDYHYLEGRNPSSDEYGVFAPDMIALVSVGEPANAHGVQKLYGLERWRGNREITRVAVHPDAPTNTASRVIAAVTERLPLEWVFSYADTGQNHHGGIYQALNAVYVGISAGRPGWRLDGEQIHPRTIVATFGTQANGPAQRIAAERGHVLEYVPGLIKAKHTYILPTGDKKSRRSLRKHLKRFAKPYPKRDGHAGGVEETTAAHQQRRDGSTPSPGSADNNQRSDDVATHGTFDGDDQLRLGAVPAPVGNEKPVPVDSRPRDPAVLGAARAAAEVGDADPTGVLHGRDHGRPPLDGEDVRLAGVRKDDQQGPPPVPEVRRQPEPDRVLASSDSGGEEPGPVHHRRRVGGPFRHDPEAGARAARQYLVGRWPAVKAFVNESVGTCPGCDQPVRRNQSRRVTKEGLMHWACSA